MNYPQPENRNLFLVIILAVVGFGVWLYYKGRNAGATFIPDVPYIKGVSALPAGFNPNILADELYAAMNDIFVKSTTKEAVWYRLLNLPTDDMIVLVYNTFNKKYGPKQKGSLTKWIDDEVVYNWGSSYKNQVLVKLRSLNLK
jgi:hypothetical protein